MCVIQFFPNWKSKCLHATKLDTLQEVKRSVYEKDEKEVQRLSKIVSSVEYPKVINNEAQVPIVNYPQLKLTGIRAIKRTLSELFDNDVDLPRMKIGLTDWYYNDYFITFRISSPRP